MKEDKKDCRLKPRGWHTAADLKIRWGLSISGTRAKIKRWLHTGTFDRMRIFENGHWRYVYRDVEYPKHPSHF